MNELPGIISARRDHSPSGTIDRHGAVIHDMQSQVKVGHGCHHD